MTQKKLLNIKNLHIHFEKHVVVQSMHLEVFPGEIVGVVGESGAGKSLLAHSILKLLPSNAKTPNGEIWFNETNLMDWNDRQMQTLRGNEISMIFQDPLSSLNPTLPIGLQIAEGLRHHRKFSAKEANDHVLKIMERVGISDPQHRYHQYPFEFSGGMRQRVMIAMALICQPKLLIADEPTTALDVGIQWQILELLKELRSEMNMSILMISHDLHVVSTICDRVIVMQKGKLVESGTKEQIFKNPQEAYTKSLLSAKKRLL